MLYFGARADDSQRHGLLHGQTLKTEPLQQPLALSHPRNHQIVPCNLVFFPIPLRFRGITDRGRHILILALLQLVPSFP